MNFNLQKSITFKVLGIGFLALLMLIPLGEVQGLIGERNALRDQAVATIAQRWGAQQQLGGPVLVVPKRVRVQTDNGWEVRDDGRSRSSPTSSTSTAAWRRNSAVTASTTPRSTPRRSSSAASFCAAISSAPSPTRFRSRRTGVEPRRIAPAGRRCARNPARIRAAFRRTELSLTPAADKLGGVSVACGAGRSVRARSKKMLNPIRATIIHSNCR